MSTGTCTVVSNLGCQSSAGLGNLHAFLYRGSGLNDIGTLGGDFSEGRGINNRGEITGGSNLVPGGPNHAFLYYGGAMHGLGQFEGLSTEGMAINDNGQIIGYVEENSLPIGFLLSGGAFHELPDLTGGTYSIPRGINRHGDVVGQASVPGPASVNRAAPAANTPPHAFLYTGGAISDLNTLFDSSLTLLTNANGINNNGQIVASGLDGQLYVLTPRHGGGPDSNTDH